MKAPPVPVLITLPRPLWTALETIAQQRSRPIHEILAEVVAQYLATHPRLQITLDEFYTDAIKLYLEHPNP